MIEDLYERRVSFEDRAQAVLSPEALEELWRMLEVLAETMKN